MDIGKPERVIVVEPLMEPEPTPEPARARQAAKQPRHNPPREHQPDTATTQTTHPKDAPSTDRPDHDPAQAAPRWGAWGEYPPDMPQFITSS